MTTPTKEQLELGAWESATVQNLDPVLGEQASRALWDAIVALRSTGDITAFAEAARELVADATPSVRDTMERALEQLAALHRAAAAAKE